jgi:hypothetical protein
LALLVTLHCVVMRSTPLDPMAPAGTVIVAGAVSVVVPVNDAATPEVASTLNALTGAGATLTQVAPSNTTNVSTSRT